MYGMNVTVMDQAHDVWVAGLTLEQVEELMARHGATSVAVKFLPERQDNDKNQIYLGMDLSGAASFIPSTNLRGEHTSSTKPGAPGKTLFQADVDFRWLTRAGAVEAPNAKLIYYPQYPEVRLSGLIRGADSPPRTLYVKAIGAQVAGRVLVLGVNDAGTTHGIILPPSSPAAASLHATRGSLESYGVLHLWRVRGERALSAEGLAAELHGVHRRGWVPGCRLTKAGIQPYWARPAGGATFEAQLGVVTNSAAEPDFQGWELKQHGGNVLTLFTSEPDGGLYAADFASFMRRYGVEKPHRHDFTGIQRHGAGPHKTNGLRLALRGFDRDGEYDPEGGVDLVNEHGDIAASWSFLKLLEHWRAKHARVAFAPSESSEDLRAYRFGKDVRLAEGASFTRLLAAIEAGRVYYDPACHLSLDDQGAPVRGSGKKRNQWRVHVKDLNSLYATVTPVDVTTVPADNSLSQRVLDALGITLPVLAN